MHPRSFYKLLIACIISVAVTIGVWVATPDYSIGRSFGMPLLPGLLEKINDVDVMSIEHSGETITFVRDTLGNWALMEADNYPADKERIRNTLIGIAGLEKIEPKTAIAEFYHEIGVEPNTDSSKSYLVTLLNADGEQLLSLLVGKSTRGVQWNGTGYFVRFPNDSQSWLVRGSLDVTGSSKTWIATRILPIKEGFLKDITLIDGSKTREISFQRNQPETWLRPTFLSDPYFITSNDYLLRMEQAFASLDFTDVAHRPEDLADEAPFTSAYLETFDGLKIYAFFYLIDQKPLIAVAFSSTDEASDDVKMHAAQLQTKHQPWLYQIPSSKIATILPFLAVPEPPKEAPKTVEEKNVEKPTVKPEPEEKKEPMEKKVTKTPAPKKTEPAKKTTAKKIPAKKATPKKEPVVKKVDVKTEPSKKEEPKKETVEEPKTAIKAETLSKKEGAPPQTTP